MNEYVRNCRRSGQWQLQKAGRTCIEHASLAPSHHTHPGGSRALVIGAACTTTAARSRIGLLGDGPPVPLPMGRGGCRGDGRGDSRGDHLVAVRIRLPRSKHQPWYCTIRQASCEGGQEAAERGRCQGASMYCTVPSVLYCMYVDA